ncbi:MAG: hypothetical protein ACYSW3_30085 [Planctomycetota bacterium]
MRYYLRKYEPTYTQTLSAFTLTIIVEDHDGVDAVTMMYSQKEGDSENISMSTQDTGVWQNVTMSQGLDGWYETTIPVSNISEPYSWCSYLVKYVANDTLGNWEVSPLCIYVFTQTIVTADWFSIDLHDTPDLWYLVGTTGHTFTWSVMDIHGQSGWPYVLYEDGHLIEMWSWSGNLTISVDGLELGNHTFELNLEVYTSERQSDTVVVHVVGTSEEIPPGVSTDNVGPLIDLDSEALDLSVPAMAIGLSLAVVIIIWLKRRT